MDGPLHYLLFKLRKTTRVFTSIFITFQELLKKKLDGGCQSYLIRLIHPLCLSAAIFNLGSFSGSSPASSSSSDSSSESSSSFSFTFLLIGCKLCILKTMTELALILVACVPATPENKEMI